MLYLSFVPGDPTRWGVILTSPTRRPFWAETYGYGATRHEALVDAKRAWRDCFGHARYPQPEYVRIRKS